MWESLFHFLGFCPDAIGHLDVMDLVRFGLVHVSLWWEFLKFYIISLFR